MKKILAVLAVLAGLVPAVTHASGAKVALERAPINLNDKISLQRGAQIFANHCLNCHNASMMRFGRLTEIGLTEAQIRENLMFTTDKLGDTMTSSLAPKDAKAWFGGVPPDLSLVARSRQPDWLYTYFKGFYRDPSSRTGWNNTVFPNVGMPHVLWEYQGTQDLEITTRTDPNSGDKKDTRRLLVSQPGKLTPVQYDQYVADLVNFLTYMGEPAQTNRKLWGILVLFFLAAFFVVTLLLKAEYWKDVR